MNLNDKIYVAGHNGLAGSAIVKNLKSKGYLNLLVKTRSELNLLNQTDVANFFKHEKPDYVILAAANVGGIVANNKYRASFIYENLQIQNNVIHQSFLSEVKKLLFLGSTCVYPKEVLQPIKEDYLLTSELEYTNEPYAIAKIAGIKMCESYNIQYGTNYISVMPTNLYGPNDKYDLEKSHVLPALLKKFHLAKLLSDGKNDEVLNILGFSSFDKSQEYLKSVGIFKDKVEVWGTGNPRREFLYSDDMADACVFLLENIDFKDCVKANQKEIRNTHINVGTGNDISIAELAKLIKKIVGYKGDIFFNSKKPDGTIFKLTNTDKMNAFGWSHKMNLKNGIQKIYNDYVK